MTFELQQIRKLRARLKPRHVRSRKVEGTELHYLEGWHVIAEANRIFGFEGWSRETVETKCVWTKQNGSRFAAAYVTRIRITVKAGDTTVIREGSGAGEAQEQTPGLAHDRAAKAAETDATKRALMTFGNAFGLSLYGDPPAAGKARANKSQVSRSEDIPSSGLMEVAKPPATAASDVARSPANGQRDDLVDMSSGNTSTDTDNHTPQDVTVCTKGQAAASPDKPVAKLPDQPQWQPFDPLEEAARIARGRIDKSQLALSEPRRERSSNHLRRVAARPCLICGRNRSQAHHLTYLQPRAMGRKVSDEFTVPLCSTHHRELHSHGNERDWWRVQGLDPEPLALEMWLEHNGATSDIPRQSYNGHDANEPS